MKSADKEKFEVVLDFGKHKRAVTLTNVAEDATWSPVLAVEEWRDLSDNLTSVVNHRNKSFYTRKLELEHASCIS